MGKIAKRNRKFLVIFIGMALVLFLIPLALAQAPIDGWDKAKFGMSPEEVRDAYKEEEEYYKDKYYQKLDYIEKRYTGDALKHEKFCHGEYQDFWEKSKEYWSREEEGEGSPHTLSVGYWFSILGAEEEWVCFRFVDDKLYNIQITSDIKISCWLYEFGSSYGTYLEDGIAENRAPMRKLVELKDALVNKYGSPLEKQEKESEKGYKRVLGEERMIPVKIEMLTWSDAKGNTLRLESHFEQFEKEGEKHRLLSYCEMNYFDRHLTQLWEKKRAQWREKVAQWKKRGEELKNKGADSF